jgi:hypothetical protein
MYRYQHCNNNEQEHANDRPESSEGPQTWEAVYSLLLWLGMLSLVPFDLTVIDSSLGTTVSNDDTTNGNNDNNITLIDSIVETAKAHLSDSGPTRDTAASCLASLFSRPDLEQEQLERFVFWSHQVLDEYIANPTASELFRVMGVIQTLAAVFKSGNRSNLMVRHLTCVELLWERAILVADQVSPRRDDHDNNLNKGDNKHKRRTTGGSLLLRKLLVKLFARVGCAHLPPKVATWRYQRGRRSLLENLSTVNAPMSKTKAQSMPLSSNTSNQLTGTTALAEQPQGTNRRDADDVEIFHVPDQVEDAMDQMINALSDPATIVRWSAAKGIGRISERLPALCADDVLDAILELCVTQADRDNAWHGACLALAELARRGLLLPTRLDEVVPIVIQAIQVNIDCILQ